MMISTPLPPPIWVSTPTALQELANGLSRQPRIAVDTESNSLHAYRESVCLIQISTPQTDYLIDSLAFPDLALVAPVFANPDIEKVFHAIDYDLIGLKRDFNITVQNLFDTMQAARILGYKQVGLEALLSQKFSVKLNKRYQKADWARRPLPPEWLDYARLDSHYLLPLRDALQIELVAQDRWELAREEFIRLAQGDESEKAKVSAWQRVKGTQKFSNRQLTVLQELCTWREAQARRMDRPPFKVIDDRRLVAIAKAEPRTLGDLREIGLPEYHLQRYGDRILKAFRRGLAAKPIQRQCAPRKENAYLNRLEALRRWRQRTGENLNIESDLVLPKSFMSAIAEKNPASMDELARIMPASPWRIAKFGEQILVLLNPKRIVVKK